MQLDKDQITFLFEFVRSKYVRYIDVQYELVDHLATDIEFQMKTHPTMSFEKALDNVYSKFPITGFSKYVSKSESEINRFWVRKIFSEFLFGYGFPYFLCLVTLTFLIYQTALLTGTIGLVLIGVLVVVLNILASRNLKQKVKILSNDKGDKYLILTIFVGFTIGFSGFPLYAAQVFFDIKTLYFIAFGVYVKVLGLSIIFSLTLLWSAMMHFRFGRLIEEVLKEKYNHLNLSM